VGPQLKYAGSAVVSGQFNPWTLIAAEQTSTGYEVAFRQPGTNYYTIWNTDSSGNYLGNPTGIVLGSDTALKSLETSFHQDLNGDGALGLPAASAYQTFAAENFLFSEFTASPSANSIVTGHSPELVGHALGEQSTHELFTSMHDTNVTYAALDPHSHFTDSHQGDFMIR
jgi:serralysin